MNDNEAGKGMLYLVGTPLGNLEDLSRRAERVLGEVDLVLAEDTRHTAKLLAAIGLRKQMDSLHADSAPGKIDRTVGLLQAGRQIAYVSDAGMPLVADPGADLVQACVAAEILVVVIPGPSAVTAALALAGFGADQFLFAGYPPRKAGERREALARLISQPYPLVLYEAPHRIRTTLATLVEVLEPERQVAICRELTKLHEEVVRGTAAEVAAAFELREPLGEFTIVVAPGSGEAKVEATGEVAAAAGLLARAGVSTKLIAEALARATGMSKREVYRIALEEREKQAAEADEG